MVEPVVFVIVQPALHVTLVRELPLARLVTEMEFPVEAAQTGLEAPKVGATGVALTVTTASPEDVPVQEASDTDVTV
jgi:hypothetical protein